MTEPKSRLIHFTSSFKFNQVIQILTFSDCLMWGGYYMMQAIVAVYLSDRILVEPLQVISLGFAIYMISRSLFQLPIAEFLDSHKTYVDEAWAIFLSCFIMSIAVVGYIFITEPIHLYIVQFIFGLGAALNMPAWRKTFARFVDRGHEGIEYSLYDIINNTSIAILTAVGGFLVSTSIDFAHLFIFSSVCIFIGGLIGLVLLKNSKIWGTK